MLVDKIVDTAKARLQKLHHPTLEKFNIELNVLRLDQIHPVISGNKFFKLKYSLQKALDQNIKGIVSFGGPWSNHLVALAKACQELGLLSAGFIRGEKPSRLSSSLIEMADYGMKLNFISRSEYANLKKGYHEINGYENFLVVPEGGCSEEGVRGSEEIAAIIPHPYDMISCAIGTGTMMAGLARGSSSPVLGFSSLKLGNPEGNSFYQFISEHCSDKEFSINYDYSFGGFGKINAELIRFMNELYDFSGLPTDIVYTGKMFYGIFDLIRKETIKTGTRICAVHSGGLQGNRSLENNILQF